MTTPATTRPPAKRSLAGTSDSVQVAGKSYQIGMTRAQLIALAGQPSEQLSCLEGYTWYVYGTKTYEDFVMAGVYQDKIVALCTSGPGFYYQGYSMLDHNPDLPASSSCYFAALTDKNDGGRFHCIWVQAKSYNPTLRGDVTTLLAGEARVDFHLVNAFRAYHGQRILSWNDKLATSARLHSADMAANHYFDHTGRNGSQPWDRVEAQASASTAAVKTSPQARKTASTFTTPGSIPLGTGPIFWTAASPRWAPASHTSTAPTTGSTTPKTLSAHNKPPQAAPYKNSPGNHFPGNLSFK